MSYATTSPTFDKANDTLATTRPTFDKTSDTLATSPTLDKAIDTLTTTNSTLDKAADALKAYISTDVLNSILSEMMQAHQLDKQRRNTTKHIDQQATYTLQPEATYFEGPIDFAPTFLQGLAVGVSAGLAATAVVALSTHTLARVAQAGAVRASAVSTGAARAGAAAGTAQASAAQAGVVQAGRAQVVRRTSAAASSPLARFFNLSFAQPPSTKSLLAHIMPVGALMGSLLAFGDGLAWWHTDGIYKVHYQVKNKAQIFTGECVMFFKWADTANHPDALNKNKTPGDLHLTATYSSATYPAAAHSAATDNTIYLDYEVGRCTASHEGLLFPRPSQKGHLRAPSSHFEFVDNYFEHNTVLHTGRLLTR